VAELVDALDLGSSGATRGGSSPPFRISTSINAARAAIPRLMNDQNSLRLLGCTLASPFDDDSTRAAARHVVDASDPSLLMQQLYRILIGEKGIRAALAHLRRAGANLEQLSIPTTAVRNTFPMTWHPLWPVPPEPYWTLDDMAHVLSRHRELLWQAALDAARELGPQRFVLLSGRAIESLFPAYTERTAFDTDLWVPDLADALDAVEALVRKLGFSLKAAHLKQVGPTLRMETSVHKTVEGFEVNVGILGGAYHSYDEPLDARATHTSWESQCLRAPSPEDLLVMLAALAKKRRRIQMVSIGDAALILRGSESLDFSLVQRLSSKHGLDVHLGVLLAHVDATWPGSVPSELRLLVDRVPRVYLDLLRRPWRRPQAVPRWVTLAFETAEFHSGPPSRGWLHSGISVLSKETARRGAQLRDAVLKTVGREPHSRPSEPQRTLPLCGVARLNAAASFSECVGARAEARSDDRAGDELRKAADRLVGLTTAENHRCGRLDFSP
jgi:hypothetical protein